MKPETTSFVKAVIALFKGVPHLKESEAAPFSPEELLAGSGVFVTERARKALPCVGDYAEFIAEVHGFDVEKANAGLFDSFVRVGNLSPKDYFVHQVLHYFSVYVQNGMDDRDTRGVDASIVHIPRRELQLPDGDPVRLVVIDAISDGEIIRRAKEMLGSGMALSGRTLDWLMDVVSHFKTSFALSEVANKEFRTRMIDMLGVMPKTAVEFLRYIAFKKTGSAMIVHSKRFVENLYTAGVGFNAEKAVADFAAQNGVEAIAREFNRHRKFWLILRHDGPVAAKIINRARRLSERMNRPATIGVLDRIGDSSVSLAAVQKELSKVTTFKKVSVANSLLRRAGHPSASLYAVRTGRSFAKAADAATPFMTEERRAILDAVVASVAADVRPNVEGRHIRLPGEIDYAFPASEKQFVGPIPALSSLSLPGNAVVGIHWQNALDARGSEERVDLDLHYTSDKIHVGWNTGFDSNDRKLVLHSGDLTNAPRPKGAAEVVYVSDAVRDDFAALFINKYTDNSGAIPFELFFGSAGTDVPDRQYLIRRREVCVHINGMEIEHPEMFVGFVESREDGKTLHFFKSAIGDSIVSSCDKHTANAIEAVQSMLRTRLSLKQVLSLAGAIFEPKEDGAWDIDLSLPVLTKDSFAFLSGKRGG